MLIDSNIIVEIGRKQNKNRVCGDFLNSIKEGMISEEIFITQFALHAIEALVSDIDSNLIKDFLLLIHQGFIKTYNSKTEDDLMAMSVKKDLKLDFDDAVQFIAANKLQTYLVTYDKDFSHTSLQTKTPEEVLIELAKKSSIL